jgi:DNA-binding NarL/FixJ family response regulator
MAYDDPATRDERRPLRVVIADDHPIVRLGVRTLVERSGGVVVGEAANGAEAVRFAQERDADLVVLDLVMPNFDGFEALRRLRDLAHPPHVVVLSVREDERSVQEALASGAIGYFVKSGAVSELEGTLRSLKPGSVYLAPVVARKLMHSLFGDFDPTQAPITEREQEILRLIANGMSARLIGEHLGISERTVNGHVNHIYRKIGVHDRVSAVREALRLGLVEFTP